MRTDEQVAQRAAVGLIVPLVPGQFQVGEEDAQGITLKISGDDHFQRLLRHRLEAAFLAAIREATAPPGDPPVSEETLALIAEARKQAGERRHSTIDSAIDDLMAQLDYYRRLCAFLLREPEGAAYVKGYEEGLAAARQAPRGPWLTELGARLAREMEEERLRALLGDQAEQ